MPKNQENIVSIFHQNVQCISNCLNNINVILSDLNVLFVALTEHWQTENSIGAFQLENYKLISSHCRTGNNSHGGVALYAEESLNYVIRNDINSLSEDCIFECASAEFKIYGVAYVICVVYTPPATNIDCFINKLDLLLERATMGDKLVLIAGDFNFDMQASTKNIKNRNSIVNLLNAYNMQITTQEPTRVSQNTSSCLDNIFIQKSQKFTSNIINTNISDHYGQKLDIYHGKNTNTKPTYEYKRIFSVANYQNLYNCLNDETWLPVYEAISVNDKYNNFITILLEHYNTSFPLKKVKIPTKKRPKWITQNILDAKETLNFLSELYQHNRLPKPVYTEYKTFYTNLLLNEKRKHYGQKIIESDNKPKTIWNIVNSETNKISLKNNKFQGIVLNNETVTSPLEVCNAFNNYFITAAPNLVGNNPTNPNVAHIPTNVNSIYLSEVTQNEVFEIINNLKNKPSAGEDHISNILLKKISLYIIKPLTHIINESLSKGIFPERLKVAVVKPIYKKGDPLQMENHRPISMLSSFSKVFEITMCTRVISFLDHHKIIATNQHGFQRGRSTTTAIFSFVEKILKSVDEGRLALGIFLDLSKAFDCVNHNILLTKLEKMGIRGPAYDWFKSYLKERTQKVSIRDRCVNYYSEPKCITMGVPQGSVLGPILFILYINDLSKVITDTTTILTNYADDTNVLITDKTFSVLEEKTLATLSQISDWFYNNSLLLNMGKTNCILFRHNRNENTYPAEIKINNVNVAFTNSTKFLGVIVDQHMNWADHVQLLCGKLSKVCYSIKELKKVVDESSLLMAYYGNFYSIMTYGILFWCGSHSQEVFKVQKRVVRIMSGRRVRESCRGLFRALNILTVTGIYIYESLCFVYNNREVFKYALIDHQYNTRNKDNYCYPIHKSTMLEKGCYYKCLQWYNCLPRHIKEIKTIHLFKKTVKKILIDFEPYSLDEINDATFR